MTQSPKIENPRFFKLLKEKELIPDGFVGDLLAELDGNALDVLATLIQSGIGTKRQLCQLWCNSIGIAHVDLEKSLFQPHVVRKIPERFARQHYVIPIYQMGDTVTVATPVPDNKVLKNQIRQMINMPVNLVFALPQDIEWAIENEYQTNSALYDFFAKIDTRRVFDENAVIDHALLEKIAGKEAVNQLHVALILLGITEQASEIQMIPEQDVCCVIFIINSQPHERLQLARPVYQQLAERLKTLAKIKADPENTSDPHYSRILFPTPGKKFDIQFLSLPVETGDKIFLKFMDRNPLARRPDLAEMYLSVGNLHLIQKQLMEKTGIMLVSGLSPGDYTPLAYAGIREIRANSDRNAITVEDAPFWLLKDVEQYHVNPKAAFTRADAMAAGLNRQPDVLFVQNIRDPDITDRLNTAAADILVIGGIQAESAIDALFLCQKRLGGVIRAVIHQQMVRRLCDHCKTRHQLPLESLREFFVFDGAPSVYAYRPGGCPYCGNTGFQGRIPVQEVLVVDDTLNDLIHHNTPPAEIRKKCISRGFRSLEYDGLKKALRGLISFEEISALRPGHSG